MPHGGSFAGARGVRCWGERGAKTLDGKACATAAATTYRCHRRTRGQGGDGMRFRLALIAAAVAAAPLISLAQNGDLTHQQATPDPHVDFGVLPPGPLGPPPCLQVGAIGGPADPCSF